MFYDCGSFRKPVLPLCSFPEISLNESCEVNFCPTFEGNKRKIESYNFSQAEPYLHHLVPKKFRESIWNGRGSSFIELPVLVSGASSNHFEEALELFPQLDTYIYPAYSTEFYFFDLGLWPSQLRKVTVIVWDQSNDSTRGSTVSERKLWK